MCHSDDDWWQPHYLMDFDGSTFDEKKSDHLLEHMHSFDEPNLRLIKEKVLTRIKQISRSYQNFLKDLITVIMVCSFDLNRTNSGKVRLHLCYWKLFALERTEKSLFLLGHFGWLSIVSNQYYFHPFDSFLNKNAFQCFRFFSISYFLVSIHFQILKGSFFISARQVPTIFYTFLRFISSFCSFLGH